MRRMLTTLSKDQGGLTLIEVVIALAIILVGLVALAAVVPLSLGHIGQANLRSTAVFLAQQRLEEVKNGVWSCFPNYTDSVGLSNPAASAPRVTTANCAPPAPLAVTGNTAVTTFADEGYGTIAGYERYRREVRITDCSIAPGCGGGVLDNGIRQVTATVFFRPQTGVGTINSAGEDVVRVTTFVALRM
jgi:prepilin-type N-terminal cleavage/methylation domain-containing protein